MDYLAINTSAGIMILLTFVLRKFCKNHLPHTVFSFLWLVIALRLLLPISVETPYSFLNWRIPLEENLIQISMLQREEIYSSISQNVEIALVQNEKLLSCCWIIGFCIVGLRFIILYVSMCKDISMTKTISNGEWLETFFKELKFSRSVSLKQKNNLDSPAVWGIWNPIILFPTNYDFTNREHIKYVILHECGHIKYFHPFCKIISMILVSVYWYNPFIWMLYLYLERDMEISSDHFALKHLKHDYRAEYAKNLLAAANRRTKVSVFYYNYNKNFLKERIEAIMNYKKLTAGALVTAMLIPASTVMVFATTDNILTNHEIDKMKISVLSESQSPVPEDLKTVLLELEWSEIEPYITNLNTKAVSYYKVSNYEYVTYGRIPPSEIDVVIQRNGYEYSGTLKLGDYKYQSSTDKYTGYYSGKVYR